MVSAMRTPSSSSSTQEVLVRRGDVVASKRHTNVNRFDSNALLDVRGVWVVRHLVGQDLGIAEGVDKGCATGSRSTCKIQFFGARRRAAHPPTTMRVNWTPFLILFPLRLPAKDILSENEFLNFGRRRGV